MQLREIKQLIKESRREGGITALEEYDRVRKLSFQKEAVSFTIQRSVMDEFRAHYKKDMSRIVEAQIEDFLGKSQGKNP